LAFAVYKNKNCIAQGERLIKKKRDISKQSFLNKPFIYFKPWISFLLNYYTRYLSNSTCNSDLYAYLFAEAGGVYWTLTVYSTTLIFVGIQKKFRYSTQPILAKKTMAIGSTE
jgi:hypothetical protein